MTKVLRAREKVIYRDSVGHFDRCCCGFDCAHPSCCLSMARLFQAAGTVLTAFCTGVDDDKTAMAGLA